MILGQEKSQRDSVLLMALVLLSVPLIVGSVLMGIFLLFVGNRSIDWSNVLMVGAITVVGLFLIWKKRYIAARWVVVWGLFFLSIWGTIQYGFTFLGVLGYVVTLLIAFLVVDNHHGIILLVIFLPPVVYRLFTPEQDHQASTILAYMGMMSVVSFLLGLLNFLNERAKNSLVQINTLEAVQQAGVSVMSSLDLQETTAKILDELKNILPHDSASVLLVREGGEGKEVELVACSGWENPYDVIGIKFPIPGDNPNSIVIQEGRPYILRNAPEDYPPFREEPHNHILSWLGVPLITKGEIIGMMAIDSGKEGYFSEEHIRVVTAFADHVAIAIENARLFEITTQAINHRSILYRASQEVIRAGADLEYIYKTIHQAASELMPAEAFVITLLDEAEEFIDGAYLIDKGGREGHLHIPLGEGLSGAVIETGRSFLVSDLLEEQEFEGEHFGEEEEVRSLVAVPFSIGNKVIGMLSAQSYQPDAYGQEELELLQLLAAQAGVAIENARLLARMEHMAKTDSLTGLKNRRAFDAALNDEIIRAARYGYPLALMILDIDDFKQFNDHFGHSKGDNHLVEIAELIVRSVRETDLVARIGGEEFSVILPHTSREGAIELAERVRLNVQHSYEGMITGGGTVSIGVAEYPRDGIVPSDLFDAADLVMFRIKRTGKNRVGIPGKEEQI